VPGAVAPSRRRRIRRAEPAQPKYLVNEIGVGYRLRVPD
jgi:hypothetical protein